MDWTTEKSFCVNTDKTGSVQVITDKTGSVQMLQKSSQVKSSEDEGNKQFKMPKKKKEGDRTITNDASEQKPKVSTKTENIFLDANNETETSKFESGPNDSRNIAAFAGYPARISRNN